MSSMLVDGDERSLMSHYRNGTSWTTADEIDYIGHLGTYNLGASRTPRLVWLQRYLDAMPLRADQQKIDPGVVRAEVVRLIGTERQKASRTTV